VGQVDNFKADPPNAELAIHGKSEDKYAVLIINTPEVKGDTISFGVRVLAESIPESFGHTTLFVDFSWGGVGRAVGY